MRKYNPLITVVAIASLCFILQGCEGGVIEEKTATANDTPQPAIKVWPPLAKGDNGDNGVVLAKNPYATNIMLVIDTSGSMADSCGDDEKLKAAKSAAISFLKSVPRDTSVGLVTFGGDVKTPVHLSAMNHDSLRKAIMDLSAGGSTPMSWAIKTAYEELVRAGRAQQGYGSYHMVILGDGQPDNVGATIDNIDWIINNSPVNVHTIGFCADLNVLAREGVNYKTAQNAGELRDALQAVVAESSAFANDAGGKLDDF